MAYLPRRPPVRTRARRAPRGAQRGVVLFVSLVLLLVLTLLGVTVARMQTGEERMAQNDTNHQLALQAADVGLDRRRRGHRGAVLVVHQLHVDVPRRPVHHQPRPLRRARELLAQPRVPAQSRHPPGPRYARTQRLSLGAVV